MTLSTAVESIEHQLCTPSTFVRSKTTIELEAGLTRSKLKEHLSQAHRRTCTLIIFVTARRDLPPAVDGWLSRSRRRTPNPRAKASEWNKNS